MTKNNIILGALVVVVLVVIGYYLWTTTQSVVTPAENENLPVAEESDRVVRDLVTDFGAELKEVSLLSPDASTMIEEHYTEFVAPELLEAWTENPEAAPGRLTSSPWPERIDIESIEEIGEGTLVVNGKLVGVTSEEAVTSGEDAATITPIQITVTEINGEWLITDFTKVTSE